MAKACIAGTSVDAALPESSEALTVWIFGIEEQAPLLLCAWRSILGGLLLRERVV